MPSSGVFAFSHSLGHRLPPRLGLRASSSRCSTVPDGLSHGLFVQEDPPLKFLARSPRAGHLAFSTALIEQFSVAQALWRTARGPLVCDLRNRYRMHAWASILPRPPPYSGTHCKRRNPRGACFYFSLTAFPTGLSTRKDQSNVPGHATWRRSANLWRAR